MPRLHQDTCRPETCIPDVQLLSGYICRRIHVAGYMLLVRDTCWLYLGDKITIHLRNGRLVSISTLCVQQQTGDKLATILSPPIQETCWLPQVDTTCIRQHLSWCKRGVTQSSQTRSQSKTLVRRSTFSSCLRDRFFQANYVRPPQSKLPYLSPPQKPLSTDAMNARRNKHSRSTSRHKAI